MQLHVRGKQTHLYILFTCHTPTGSLSVCFKVEVLQSTFETFQLLSNYYCSISHPMQLPL